MNLTACLSLLVLASLASATVGAEALGPLVDDDLKVITVTGEVSARLLGTALPHEHVMVDFAGADKCEKGRYDSDEVFDAVLPHLVHARKLGLGTLFECTPEFLARDPLLLRRLSQASGLRIVTNTGLYGAAADKFLPAYAITETADQLAARWTSEWESGIGTTGIRPGFIKIGVDGEPSETDMKLVEAAALTHLRTGLTIASHTGPGKTAKAQIETLRRLGVDASAFVWVHANAEPDSAAHIWAARQGSWVEFDGLSPASVEGHVALVKVMRGAGLLGKVLVSHDAGWYSVGEGAGAFRPFDTLFTEFLPALRKAGFSDSEITEITRTNPQRAFGRRVRRAAP